MAIGMDESKGADGEVMLKTVSKFYSRHRAKLSCLAIQHVVLLGGAFRCSAAPLRAGFELWLRPRTKLLCEGFQLSQPEHPLQLMFP